MANQQEVTQQIQTFSLQIPITFLDDFEKLKKENKRLLEENKELVKKYEDLLVENNRKYEKEINELREENEDLKIQVNELREENKNLIIKNKALSQRIKELEKNLELTNQKLTETTEKLTETTEKLTETTEKLTETTQKLDIVMIGFQQMKEEKRQENLEYFIQSANSIYQLEGPIGKISNNYYYDLIDLRGKRNEDAHGINEKDKPWTSNSKIQLLIKNLYTKEAENYLDNEFSLGFTKALIKVLKHNVNNRILPENDDEKRRFEKNKKRFELYI